MNNEEIRNFDFIEHFTKTFDESIQNNKDHLVDVNDYVCRGVGKTTVLNEISLIYQSQGYEVILWTPYNNEYYATKFIRKWEDIFDIHISRFNHKIICIVDEVNLKDKESRMIYHSLQDSGVICVGWIKE